MDLAEAILKLKESEGVESSLILTGKDPLSANLRKTAIAWTKVPLTVKRKQTYRESDEDSLWEDVWKDVEIDLTTLGIVTGFRTRVELYVNMLKGYRLIYPDGSLSAVALKTLRQLAKFELGL